MAPNFKTPGVYIQEVSTPAPVAGVGTAIPAFVGYVQKSDKDGDGIPMLTPIRINSFSDYEALFGGADPQGFDINANDINSNGNTTRTLTVTKNVESIFKMYYNIRMYFSNGGGPCWIVPVGIYALTSAIDKDDLISGLQSLEKESEPTLLLYPDVVSINNNNDIKEVNTAAIDQCNNLKNRFTIMDVKQENPETPFDDASTFRNDMTGIESLKYAAAYYPYLDTTMNFSFSQLHLQITDYTLNGNAVLGFSETKNFNGFISSALQFTFDALNYLRIATNTLSDDDADKVKDLVNNIQVQINDSLNVTGLPSLFDEIQTNSVIAVNSAEMVQTNSAATDFDNTPSLSNANALKIALNNLLAALNSVADSISSAFNATTEFIGGNLNYLQNNRPSIYSEVISEINGYRVTINPSGTMAGIYARVDNNRGVWQAPANVGVRDVIGPSVLVSNDQQGLFNVDSSSGKSINVIRNFVGRGTLPWGARTLDGNSNEWRYINVRRLYIYVEESIKRSTQFVVFEPNNSNTWVRTRGIIENFLTDIWKGGGLVGTTAEEAFYVNIGLDTSMTTTDILEGRMIIEVGIAAVRPAEFIVLRITRIIQE